MSFIGVQNPPVPRLSSADEMEVRRALRRNRLLATGLLAVMIVMAAATRIEPSPGWLVQLVRAGAEAGIIGGLADWFAITVLFRHPFGIPIPHTAILPRNKDRIGRSLGSFVERNFLVPEVSFPKIISGYIGDAAQPRLEWLRWRQTVGQLDATAHLYVMPSAYVLDCNTPHRRKVSGVDASRRRCPFGPGNHDVVCRSDVLQFHFATAIQERSAGRECPSPSPDAGRYGRMHGHCRGPDKPELMPKGKPR